MFPMWLSSGYHFLSVIAHELEKTKAKIFSDLANALKIKTTFLSFHNHTDIFGLNDYSLDCFLDCILLDVFIFHLLFLVIFSGRDSFKT